MRILIALVAFGFTTVCGAAELATISSDKDIYATGETAILQIALSTQPDNTNYEFDAVGDVDGLALEIDRSTPFALFSTDATLQAGTDTWTVHIVLQDARYARDLKTSIGYFTQKITDIDARLATETDPTVIANLQTQRSKYVGLLAASQSELTEIRSEVKTLSLNFEVQ
jgi:hypothetical protein